jgi:hypothetical protein
LASLSVFHISPPTFTAEAIHEMHVCIFFICEHVRHFDYNHSATQYIHTSLYSLQAGTHVRAIQACDSLRQ